MRVLLFANPMETILLRLFTGDGLADLDARKRALERDLTFLKVADSAVEVSWKGDRPRCGVDGAVTEAGGLALSEMIVFCC